jgi:tRNA A-37 threonylcarbamoyl transferase component Bud32
VWALVLVVLLARVYTGAHLPLDVIGGAALGWAVGATVHLLIGAPTARLSPRATRTVLEGMGFALDEGVTVQDSGRHALVRTAAGQPLFVTVLVREHRDTDLVHRGWRRLGSRWVREHGRFVPPLARVHHHAALALLARNAGVRAPEVVAVGTFGNGSAVLVERHVEGRRLRQLQSEEVLAVLPGVWEQVAALRRAHISHGDLGAANVLVDGAGQAWLLDFTAATSGASDTRLTDDVADLLAALTELVGADSAVRSAVDGIGSSGLAALTDRLRHPYRSGQSREVRAARRNLLSALGALNTPRGSS